LTHTRCSRRLHVQDASTVYSVIKWLRAMCHTMKQTVLISLLQPPPETFALFDDVMIMAKGMIAYHGPVKQAVGYMCSFGFELPPRKVRDAASDISLRRALG
jgi:ABC-type multidrug transport system ATPase subunit